jgi:ankyrin repeat protein
MRFLGFSIQKRIAAVLLYVFFTSNLGCTIPIPYPYDFAKSGNIKVLKWLLENGLDINHQNNYKKTLLYGAVEGRQLSTVHFLIQKGARVNIEYMEGHGPLREAIFKKEEEIAKLLIAAGANIHQTDLHGSTLLHGAASRGALKVSRLLIEKGLEVDVLGPDGGTPLHSASFRGQTAIVEFFLRQKADIEARNHFQTTPLLAASKKGHREVVELLLNHGADVNARAEDGYSSLFWADQYRLKDISALLIKHGASREQLKKYEPSQFYRKLEESLQSSPFEAIGVIPLKTQAAKIQFSGDGSLFAAGSNEVTVWETSSRKHLASLRLHRSGMTSMTISRDGRFLVSGSTDKTIRMWDLRTQKEVRRFGNADGFVYSVRFSPSNVYLLSGGSTKIFSSIWKAYLFGFAPRLLGLNDDYLQLWDPKTGREIRRFVGIRDNVTQAEFSPDGRFIVSIDVDGGIRVWETETGEEFLFKTYRDRGLRLYDLVMFPDGKRVGIKTDKFIDIIDIESGRVLKTIPDAPRHMTLLDGGKILIGIREYNKLKAWNTDTAELITQVNIPYNMDRRYIFNIKSLPSGKSFFIGTEEKELIEVQMRN